MASGRHGVVHTVLQHLGVVDAPLEWLLYSEFAVVVGYIHLYTLFMIVPIFNAMMRIDRALLKAAGDSAVTAWQTLWHVIVPLCKPGIVIGSIFVIAACRWSCRSCRRTPRRQ